MTKSLRRRPECVRDVYAESVARSGDWTILVQPARKLPLGLTHLISLSLKDEGNRLFEETRELNNRYAGNAFRAVEVMLAADPEHLDLRARALAWGSEVARQVSFKLRHRARTNPYRAYLEVYADLITHIDTVMVHGYDRLYQTVWSSVLDLLPFRLLESMLIVPGHFHIEHAQNERHLPHPVMTDEFKAVANQQQLMNLISLYGVEPAMYLDRIILSPLLATLRATSSWPSLSDQRDAVRGMLADVLEVFPYLVSSDRAERLMFRIPGTTCVGTFSFVATCGYATFTFYDDEPGLLQGIHTNFARAGIEIGYDGQLSSSMHPWRTLDRVFAAEDALTLTYWLLKQVHGRLLQDYLSIENYYLHPCEQEADATADMPEEAVSCVGWAKAAQCEMADGPGEEEEPSADAAPGYGSLPQLRRRTFFKLLAHCGVSIEQGKGSELKLLRKARHPFRLGNHYGSNPTIPTFLAAAILKRLEITRHEWLDAMAAH